MMSASVPSSDALSGATNLLAALADPAGAQRRLDELKAATDEFNESRDLCHKAQAELADAQKAIDAQKAEIADRLAACAATETASQQKSGELDARAAELDELRKDIEARTSAFVEQSSAWADSVTAKASELASREQYVADREHQVSERESSLEDKIKQTKAQILDSVRNAL